MRLNTNPNEIELIQNSNRLFDGKPKFSIIGWSIILSDYNMYQDIHLSQDVFGSMLFMMSENDILVFSKESLNLHSLEIRIPFNIEFIENPFPIIQSDKKGILKIKQEIPFTLEYTSKAFYCKKEESLILTYHNQISNLEIFSRQITKDFYALESNNTIIGWKLDRINSYLYSPYLKQYHKSNSSPKLHVEKILSLYKEEIFTKMDSEDINLKANLIDIQKNCEIDKCEIVSELIGDWLDSNYH